ncbi:MAG TPA: hypothetical protein VKU00_09015 [Chthonomonadaceae bacterium]|nr:hypothetical protein [Chthonomonadaceae bacterium]
MRYVTPVIICLLVLSGIMNMILFLKYRAARTILSVNGQSVTKATMYGYLEQQYGPSFKAMMVRRLMIDQEAHAQGVAPTDDEVDEQFNRERELTWQFAKQLADNPWMAEEFKNQIREQQEQEALRAKDIPVTDEELKEEYATYPQRYDTPNKAHCLVAVILSEAHTEDIRRRMEQTAPPISPLSIRQEFPREVTFIGDNYRYTFLQAFGTQDNQRIFTMTPKEVKVLDAPPELAQLGARKLIVRLEDNQVGHRADLNDPKIIQKLRHNVALRHARPYPELLSTLWAKARLDFDDPNDRVSVEHILFPERVTTTTEAGKQ